MKARLSRAEMLKRVSYTLSFEKGKEVVRYLPRSKTALLRFFRAEKNKKWASKSVTVKYLPGVTNTADFENETQLKQILLDWTDTAQLEFVYGGEW